MYSFFDFLKMASKIIHVVFIQIEEAAVEYFDKVVKKDNLQVDMKTPFEPEVFLEYIKGWRKKIWDQGFGPILKGATTLKKSDAFLTMKVQTWLLNEFFLNTYKNA